MEHSRLLKFLVPDTVSKMAEPVKIKFDYQNRENVEDEVPGTQRIREHLESETGQNNKDESSKQFGEISKNNEVSRENLEIATNDDFSVEPVIVVTKKEATFTKGDLKLQKVTVTEDISVKYQHLFKKQTLPGKTVVTQESENGDVVTTEIQSEITTENVEIRRRHVFNGKRNGIHGEPVMLGENQINSSDTEKPEDKKIKTKIPISRFRQTVERVKAEKRGSKEAKGHESHIPIRRSSIPKPVKEHNTPTSTVKKEITVTKSLTKKDTAETVVTKNVIRNESKESIKKIENKIETIDAEDEFDKLFADVVNNPETDIDDSLLNPKVEDPDNLESKFEEIIHDYEEHKAHHTDVEVVRRSKLPLLKRRSQQDIELNAQAERTSKIIAARDKLRLRHSMNKDENFEKALDEELKKIPVDKDSNISENKVDNPTEKKPSIDTKTETKHEIISSPNSKVETFTKFTKTVSTSSENEIENEESSSVVQTTTAIEMTKNETKDIKVDKKHYITEDNIMKNSIKIGIPVFDSQIHEYSETSESTKTIEMKQTMSYTSAREELSVKNNVSERKTENNISDTSAEQKVSQTETETSVSRIINDFTTKTISSDINFDRLKEVKHEGIEIRDTKLENFEYVRSSNVQSSKPTGNDRIETDDTPIPTRVKGIEEEVQLRGNVENLINKISSKELIETEKNQRESINELTKKKSVLSKIAMFEKKPEDSDLKRVPKKETKLPKLNTKTWQNEKVHVHTPLIVDEVFKPFDAEIIVNDGANKDVNPTNDLEITTLQQAERVSKQSFGCVHYAAENNVQIEHKTIEEKAIEITSQQLTPNESRIDSKYMKPKDENTKIDILRPKELTINDLATPSVRSDKFEFKYSTNKVQSPTRLSMTKEIQAPVIIPGFKPVSALLKSFESKADTNKSHIQRTVSKEQTTSTLTRKVFETNHVNENISATTQISRIDTYTPENYDNFESVNDYKSLDDVFTSETDKETLKLRQEEDMKRAKSLAELDLGDAVKGKVNNMILRIKSVDRMELERREAINKKEMPRKRSVSEKIALFEGKLTPTKSDSPLPLRIFKTDRLTENLFQNTERKTSQKIDIQRAEVTKITEMNNKEETKRIDIQRERSVTEFMEKNLTEVPKIENDDEEIKKKIEELRNAKNKYGKLDEMPGIELSNRVIMPALAVGTALLDPRLAYHIVAAAIDLGYRAIDTAYIYGNEKLIGEAIRDKIADGTVKREDLFIISKLWSTYHRTDLVEVACRASLDAMGLDYFDLYLIHNPMSFKEGGGPMPKIATVLQYSEYDYLDAWYGMEKLVAKGLARAIGVSNFNSLQLQRVLDKGRVKPVVNQVECHPYLSQQRLDLFCSDRNVTLSCFGVLGSKGTPPELKNGQPAVIDDALIQVMASGLGITPAQLLISYQLENGHGVVVKSSSAHHLHDNLLALGVRLTTAQVDALHALNRNKRMFTYKGMGDTHKNYPFHAAF